mmetsp:Transcript_32816/g.71627  ORF Transcript_32816/g.71627 Transcript_32816/m.71627 type:complete len:398 (+) Transcript_32816:57-1250(+)
MAPDGELRLLVTSLKMEVNAMREELAAVRSCLDLSGHMPGERFLAQLHRQRFQASLRTHPCQVSIGLKEVLGVDRVAAAVVEAGTWCSTSAVLGACHALATSLITRPDLLPGVPAALDGTVHLWHPVPGTMRELPGTRQDVGRQATAQINGTFYRCGGRTTGRGAPINSAQCFDQTRGAWIDLPSMSTTRLGHSATALDGKLYVCGGFEPLGMGVWHSSMERYHPRGKTWTLLPPMTYGRHFHAAAALKGELFVCGGHTAGGVVNSMEKFNPSTGTWRQMPSMPSRCWRHTAAAFYGKLYVCDGESGGISTEVYDPVTDVWSQLRPLRVRASPRESHSGGLVIAMTAWQGILYVACKETSGSRASATKSMHRLRLGTTVWDQVPLAVRVQPPSFAGA